MEDKDSKQLERAQRVKAARALSCKPRKFFEDQHGIKGVTLLSWESPKSKSTLTYKGAVRLSDALLAEGIYCSPEWLLEGIGPEAKILSRVQNENETWNEGFSILKEIELFKQSHKNAIISVVLDDGMLPFYGIGDYVGGILRDDFSIADYHNRRCIVVTKQHGTLVRLVSKGNNNPILSCLNPTTTLEFPVLFEEKIVRIAEVVWHRKKEFK